MSKHTTTPATLDARVTYLNKYTGGRTVELLITKVEAR